MKHFRILLAAALLALVSTYASAQVPGPAVGLHGKLIPGNCIDAFNQRTIQDAGVTCGGGSGGSANPINVQAAPYNANPNWAYVAGSATGTGANNAAALTSALNSCGQNGASFVLIPPGKFYIGSVVSFGACDTTIVGTAQSSIVCNLAITCLRWAPTWGTQQALAGIIEGYTNTNGNGWTPTTTGAGCEVGDILTLPTTASSYARNIRDRTLFQVATCTGAAVATLNTIQAGEYLQNPGANAAGNFQTVSGTTTGVTTTNLTWTTGPALGGVLRTELVLNGPNATTEGGNCTTLTSDGTSICMGDKLKIVSNQNAPWQYSNGLRNTSVVINTSDPTYGPVVAAGGSGCTAGDVLTAVTQTSPVTRGAAGMPVQAAATTPATLTVGTVTATGAITSIAVTTGGTYDHISYGPIALSGGTCSTAPQVYLTFTNANAVGYADITEVAQVIDATHILLSRLTYFPHVFDATNPPVIEKLPAAKLVIRDLNIQASGQTHNTAYSGRIPAGLYLLGAIAPEIDNLHCVGAWERCVNENSVWHGDYHLTIEDAVDMPTQSGFGYGWCSSGASEAARVQMNVFGARHGVTSCAIGYTYTRIASNFAEIGSTADALIHDTNVTGTHISCFDTHEDAINWMFANIKCSFDTPDPRDTTAVSAGIDNRSYNTSIHGMQSEGVQVCVQDASQRFPFSGVFYRPSVMTSIGLECRNADMTVATGGVPGIGYQLQGSSQDASYGSQDPYAQSIIMDSHFVNFPNAITIGEGANKLSCIGCNLQGVGQMAIMTGPNDLDVINTTMDNTSLIKVPAAQEYVRRSIGTHENGTNIVNLINNFIEQTTVPSGSTIDPQTLYRTLETTAGNSTTLNLGGNKIVGKMVTGVQTAGGTVTVVNTDWNPLAGDGVQKVTAVGVSMAATGDAATIPIPPQISKYRVLAIDVGNCSASLATALAGVWSGAAKTGTNIAANQALSACTGTTKNAALTLAAGAATDDLTSANLFVNVGTLQSSPTADVTIWLLDKSTH